MQSSRTKRLLLIATTAALSLIQGCNGGGADPGCAPVFAAPPATSDAIAATLESIRSKYRLNAIIVGVEQNGVPLYRTAVGISTPGVPATTDMHFRIGGVGWQMLTTVLLRTVEQEPTRIALTAPVARWYPAYPNADRATVRMLAASSAGFGDYITTDRFIAELVADPLRVWTADDLMTRSLLPYQTPQFADPGRDWAYSHTDFVALGAILEKATGTTYAALLQAQVLDPLGLHDTRLQLDTSPQLPILHTLQEGDFRDSTYWNPSFVSWAAVTSNVCDLGTWNRAFGTGTLLSPQARGEVTAPVNVGLGPNTAQAYFGLGTLVFPPWVVQRAAYWGMYTTTAFDVTTGISVVATVSLSADTPPNVQPSVELVAELSRLLTPDHPVPR